MTRMLDIAGKCIVVGALALSVPLGSAHAERSETVLYAFKGGSDGQWPEAGLISDKAGNLYGTTWAGGNVFGTVFRLAPDGTETVLYAFKGGSDGEGPDAGVIADSAGNLYGTTQGGGTGDGTVFKLAPDGTETVLYAFKGGNDGDYPVAGLIRDSAHNLYGTTLKGGGSGNCTSGCGTVFKLAPDGTETVLHAFAGGTGDGASPSAGLMADSAGNLYGTTEHGGTGSDGNGGGTVFKLASNGTETVLYNFCSQINCADGEAPWAGLIADGAGNLYGTTGAGGVSKCGSCGTVFRLAPDGTETVLHASKGEEPIAGVIADKAGTLYGTTFEGGADNRGIVFKVETNGREQVLYAFTGGSDGENPFAGLINDRAGNLYGTTYYGGGTTTCNSGCGTVFEFQR